MAICRQLETDKINMGHNLGNHYPESSTRKNQNQQGLGAHKCVPHRLKLVPRYGTNCSAECHACGITAQFPFDQTKSVDS